MKKYIVPIMCVLLCIQLEKQMQAQAKANPLNDDKANTLTLVVTDLELDTETLKLSYEITNNSKQDAWICNRISQGHNFEVYLDDNDNGETLVIRKRLDVPSSFDWYARPLGKYVRLGAGQKRNESLLLDLPINPIHIYYEPDRDLRGVFNAKRLSIEIGYYVGNLPEMFMSTSEKSVKSTNGQLSVPNIRLGATLGFNETNESLLLREEEVLIVYTYQVFQGERVLSTAIDDLSIPYKETIKRPRHNPPDLTACTRVTVQYKHSLLDYFYPYESQQRLLNKKEIKCLQSQKSVVIDDAQDISGFATELIKAKRARVGIVSEKSEAEVIAHQDGKRVVSFIVYDDTTIETEENQRIKYIDELQSLKKFTPQIQAFELRMQCAANLKNLWYRLRFYDRAEKYRILSLRELRLDDTNRFSAPKTKREIELNSENIQKKLAQQAEPVSELKTKDEIVLHVNIDLVYPAPRRWCDALELAFTGWSRGSWYDSKMKAHVCPGANGGRSSYAMNRNCKYDSPPEMVLLFETKAGWNQHGGPELFTFDNHNPKGGCVLLNDGTVKFIRTKEELTQLRWK